MCISHTPEALLVSIHAPREGCDTIRLTNIILIIRFNSRTPGGVRQEMLTLLDMTRTSFNSRTPGGVRQIILTVSPMILLFQFTHPGRGATQQRSKD